MRDKTGKKGGGVETQGQERKEGELIDKEKRKEVGKRQVEKEKGGVEK